MSSNELSVEEARARLGDCVIAAMNGQPTVITRYGRPAAMIVSIPRYAYRIEVSDDGAIWDLYRDDARGVEATDADPGKLANLILTNHLADRRTNGEDLDETRVLLWKGDEEGLVEDALIVEADLMPNES
jgi:prevent-host-death family protein